MGILKNTVVVMVATGMFVATYGVETKDTVSETKEVVAQSRDTVSETKEVVTQSTVEVETERHRACRLELHRENPYGGTYNGQSVLVWDTPAFGTYDDGDVWVGYNRKVGDRVFYNMAKICG